MLTFSVFYGQGFYGLGYYGHDAYDVGTFGQGFYGEGFYGIAVLDVYGTSSVSSGFAFSSEVSSPL